jgi:hypothetical protein
VITPLEGAMVNSVAAVTKAAKEVRQLLVNVPSEPWKSTIIMMVN